MAFLPVKYYLHVLSAELMYVFVFSIVHTLAELKMTGNCLKGSRPLLSFDPVSSFQMSFLFQMLSDIEHVCILCNTFICFAMQKFDKEPHYALLKELFTQVCVQETCINSEYTVTGIKQKLTLAEKPVHNLLM